MPQDSSYNDLVAFLMVARERSFTKAAAKLGVSQSALSQTVRNLEERLGLRLLARTTRSVSPTDAGERLLNRIAPRFDEINSEVAALSEMRDRPAGTIRITAGEHAAISVIAPALARFLPENPDIHAEVAVDYGLTDIVTERFDAGVRMGDYVAKDMIAVRIGPDMRMVVVGSPAYFDRAPIPRTPHDLTVHNCINIRLPTHGTIYGWEFEKDGHEVRVKVEGQTVFNNIAMRMTAVLNGMGLAYMPEDLVLPHIKQGHLVQVLDDWCQPFSGYHLYYPNRRHPTPAFRLFVDALRYRR